MGHHPIDEIDEEDFTSALQDHGFDLYLNGHAHTLTQYTIDEAGAYVTSGAGAMIATADQDHEHTRAKVEGQDLNTTASQHSYQTVWNQKVAGFTLHTFSDDLSTLTTDFVTYTGDTVHSFTVTKGNGRIKQRGSSEEGEAVVA